VIPKKKPPKQLTFVEPKDEAKKREKGFFSPRQYFAISGSQNNTACGTNLTSCCYSCTNDVPSGCTATECCLPNKVCDPVATQPCCNSSDNCLQSTVNGSFVCTPCLEVGVLCNNQNDLCCDGSVCYDGNGTATCVPCVNNNASTCFPGFDDFVGDSTCCSDAPLCYPNDLTGFLALPTCHSCAERNYFCLVNQTRCCTPGDNCVPSFFPPLGFCVPPVCYANGEQCVNSGGGILPACCDPDYDCVSFTTFDFSTCQRVHNCIIPLQPCVPGEVCCANNECTDKDGDGNSNCTPLCVLEGRVCDARDPINECCAGTVCVEAGIFLGAGTCQQQVHK